MKKRTISLGFKGPLRLEKDDIYLSIYYGGTSLGTPEDDPYGLHVDIISNKEFIYHVNEDAYRKKKATWIFPYKHSAGIDDLINDLMESNDAVLSHSRMIDWGCKTNIKIEEFMESLKEPLKV